MGRLALVAGTGLLGESFPEARRLGVETARGAVVLLDAGSHVILQRHGLDSYRPPHLIDHAANLAALREAGCDRAVALSSVGSLDPELPVGSVVCPDDFIALQLGLSSFEDPRGHVAPGFDPPWRRSVLAAWPGPLRDGGTYWQATGPRLETPAEIRMIAPHADVIGMTVASECVIATEMELPYAAVCVVDNMANGLAAAGEHEPRRLDMAALLANTEASRGPVLEALAIAIPELAG